MHTISGSLVIHLHTYTHRSSRCLRHSPHPHGHPRVCGLFALILLFYFLLYFPPFFLFLNDMKSMVNLHNSCNEGVDASDDLLLSTGYEPKAHDFYETTVDPYVQLLDSPPQPTMTLHSKTCSIKYIECKSITLYEKSSSSMSDRTGQPVGGISLQPGERRSSPGEHRSSEAQIWTLLDDQKEQILAECQARINQHQLQAARAEEEQRLLQGQLLQQKLEFREAHQRSLTEMEEVRKFQSSTFDTMARRKLVEDQNTILELSGRIQELQNDIDSKEFQDAESIRSVNSLVTSRPVSFLPHPILEVMLRHSFVTPSRREGPPSIWDTWCIGKLLQIHMCHHQHLIRKSQILGSLMYQNTHHHM